MANPFVHVELATTDVAKAKQFYGKLFAWKLEDTAMDGGTYTMINVGDATSGGAAGAGTTAAATSGAGAPAAANAGALSGIGGGIMNQPVPGAPSAWLAYVLVDDVQAATQKAKSLGASVMKDVTDAGGYGRFSIILDPTGAALGLFEPSRKQ